jgi:hypothetical protein
MVRFITSPNKLGLAAMLIVILMIYAVGVLCLPDRETIHGDIDVVAKVSPVSAESDTDIDYAGQSLEKPTMPIDARLIGQLANGMRDIKARVDGGLWGFCGELLSDDEQVEVSTAIAYHLVVNMQSVGLDDVSPWGIVATMYNESRLDACALGIGPREWAYRNGLLNTPRRFLSHTSSDVLKVVTNTKARQRFSTTGFDLGFGQVLTRFYPNQEEAALTIEGGVRIIVIEMQARARRNKTKTPWLFWPGSNTGWYRAKIRRWARLMGAPKKEVI